MASSTRTCPRVGSRVGEHPTGGGEEVARRVLGGDPDLDRVAVERHVVLGEAERLAGGDPQLQLDQVEAGDELGDRVLDLQAGVDLEEEVLGGVVEAGDELDRAGVDVAAARASATASAPRRSRSPVDTTGEGDSSITFWWRRCREHSRSPRCSHVAVGVGDHLHLEVARPRQVALDEHAVVAEAGVRLAPRRRQRGVEILGVRHDAHAAPAAAGGGLDQQRIDDLFTAVACLGFGEARDHRDARRGRRPPWRAACRP